MTTYALGSLVEMAGEFENAAGAAANPADVVLTYRKPDGTEVTKPKADLTNDAVGRWSLEVAADQPGEWAFRFVATTPTVTIEDTFTVEPSVLEGDMLQPGAGPCDPWASLAQVTDGWTMPAGASDALAALCLRAASDLMFARGGRQFPGICSDVVIPSGACSGFVAPYPEGGVVELHSVPSGHRHPGMCCDGGHTIGLGSYPVRQVLEVLVDGDALDPAAYTVVDWRLLVRVDGGRWPCCNDPADTPPRLQVTFTFGQPPPASGVLAVVALTRELIKALTPGQQCALDRRVTQINREGTTITLPGLIDSLREGKTGVHEVDMFLWAHNPNGLARRGRILDLSGAGVRRRTL